MAENVAPSIFVQTETQAEAFAKLGNLDAEQIAEQMANLDDEIFQFADDNGEGAGELRQRFDALFELSGHELVEWLDRESMEHPLWYVANKLLHSNMDGEEVSDEMREALWQELEDE